jgi:FAD/FMN-containing dehydrogenase
MNRRAFLKAAGSMVLLPMLPERLLAAGQFSRRRPSDLNWPSRSAWNQLKTQVGGNLIPVKFPLNILKTTADSAAAKQFSRDIRNPYFIADHPGLTETLGWVDAWATKPSVYAVAARNANDIAAAVNFASDNDLRLVVKGRGHSYLGGSNAPDSLMIWTRHMTDIEMHSAFVPQGCNGTVAPQPAVTMGAGTYGMQAYQVVTTQGGRYVQCAGCTTVGIAGLIQGGGFGSYSKRYGTAAASLLEAEVVTAEGKIRIANTCTNPDLFWALKGGGGGTFGVVSKLTLRTHDLPEYFGVANFNVRAASDDAYRRLVREFVSFYAEHLFNDHWGEQARFSPGNTLGISMVSQGLDAEQAQKVWQPFLDWVKHSPHDYSIEGRIVIGSFPARHMWDVEWLKGHWPELAFPRNGNPLHAILDDVLVYVMHEPIFQADNRPGAAPSDVWWNGDAGQVGWYIWGYESLWMPAALLASDSQQKLADAMYASSRLQGFSLHFNKGLAGAPPNVLAEAKNTAMNPAVCDAFALVIAAYGQGPAYPGISGHEPEVKGAHAAVAQLKSGMNALRAVTGETGSYVNETNYFQKDWQQAFWGGNYPRLLQIKQKYDPNGLFFVHNGVGSEGWSRDGFAKL